MVLSMEDVMHFIRGIGGLIVLFVAGYFVGGWLFTIRMEDEVHNFVFELILAVIFLGIIAGMIGIIIELSNI